MSPSLPTRPLIEVEHPTGDVRPAKRRSARRRRATRPGDAAKRERVRPSSRPQTLVPRGLEIYRYRRRTPHTEKMSYLTLLRKTSPCFR